jgi:hypothetical protein
MARALAVVLHRIMRRTTLVERFMLRMVNRAGWLKHFESGVSNQ